MSILNPEPKESEKKDWLDYVKKYMIDDKSMQLYKYYNSLFDIL